jgi:structural maintenance of chromosome 1
LSRSLHEGREKEAALASEIPGLEQKVQYTLAEAKVSEEKSQRLSKEADQVEAEAEGRQAEVTRLQSGLGERRAKVESLTTRINEVADRLFASFSKSVGVASVREWEQKHADFERQVAEKRASLQQQAAKLDGQISYERGR